MTNFLLCIYKVRKNVTCKLDSSWKICKIFTMLSSELLAFLRTLNAPTRLQPFIKQSVCRWPIESCVMSEAFLKLNFFQLAEKHRSGFTVMMLIFYISPHNLRKKDVHAREGANSYSWLFHVWIQLWKIYRNDKRNIPNWLVLKYSSWNQFSILYFCYHGR